MGRLEVRISGLPSGLPAQLRIENLSGLSQNLSASQTLELKPGTYSVRAEDIAAGERSYLPNPSRKVVEVAGGGTLVVEVEYLLAEAHAPTETPNPTPEPEVSSPPTEPAATGSLLVEAIGLPQGLEATLELLGPDGVAHTSHSGTLTQGLAPGQYSLVVAEVARGSERFIPDRSRIMLSVVAGKPINQKVSFAQVQQSGTVKLSGMVFSPAREEGVSEAQYVADEAIVQWKHPPASVVGASTVRSLGASLSLLRRTQSGVSLQREQELTLKWIESLRQREDVVFAEPNYWRYPSQTTTLPNDPLDPPSPSADPLHLNPQTGGAWQRTTGSPQVVVAVLDTGILWRQGDPAATHPDFRCGRILPGYDFVSYSQNGDGDGRDADPYSAPGDDHGSHVAGLIGACANNGLGIRGVDWQARLLPLRVLGQNGGTDADILDALRWAVGLAVKGVPLNPTPAKVINLSLGGLGLSRAYELALQEVTAQGAIVVVAAGNAADQTLRYLPAGLEQVITVGAVEANGQRARFSNYGLGVELMAPGVDIRSTTEGAVRGSFGYNRYSGTSMASPQVAGVVALMAAVKPDLQWFEAFDYLSRSAQPLPGCEGCGAGLVDAGAAVALAQSRAAVGGVLSPSLRFDFGASQTQAELHLHNYGAAAASFEAESSPYLSLSPAQGTLAPGQSLNATLQLKRSAASGNYYAVLPLRLAHQSLASALYVQYFTGSGVANLGTVELALCQDTATGPTLVARQSVPYTGIYTFSFQLPALSGSFYLRAWVDADHDGLTEFASAKTYLELNQSDTFRSVALSKADYSLSRWGCTALPAS